MIKRKIILIVFFVFSAMQIASAQSSRLVILNLKNGYSVKGEIIEQTEQGLKIKALGGEIFEYKNDEIVSKVDAKDSSSSNKLFSSTKAVSKIYSKGDKIINIGIGLFNQNSDYISGNNKKLLMPAIPLSFEYIIKDDLFNGKGDLGIGGYFGYTATKDLYFKYSKMVLGARGYVHYALVEKLDTYAGAFLGYKGASLKNNPNVSSNMEFTDKDLFVSAFAGCRYFFDDKIAGTVEIGWGISIVTIGVAIKL